MLVASTGIRPSTAWFFCWGLLLGTPIPVSAALVNWGGGGSNDFWSNAVNWTGNTTPGLNDTANLVNDGDTVVDTDFTVQGVAISGFSSVRNSIILTLFDPIVSHTLGSQTVSMTANTGSSAELFIDGVAPGTPGLSVEQDLTVGPNSQLFMTSLGNTASPRPAIVDVVEGQLNINAGGSLVGSGELNFGFRPGTDPLLVNDGTLHVRILSPFFDPDDLEGFEASTLTIAGFTSSRPLDLDGTTETGTIHIDNRGTLVLDNPVSLDDRFNSTFRMDSQAVLDTAFQFNMEGGDLIVDTTPGQFETGPPGFNAAVIRGSSTFFTGGSTITLNDVANDKLRFETDLGNLFSNTTFNNRGQITFASPVSVFPGTVFNLTGSGSEVIVEDTFSGSPFTATGAGLFRIAPAGTFRPSSTDTEDTTIDARFRNEGLIQIVQGSFPRQLVVADFVQTDGATLELGGREQDTGPSVGRVRSTGDVTLDGDLLLTRALNFFPAVNDQFTLVSAAGTLTGAFDSVDASAFHAIGLDAAVTVFTGAFGSVRVQFIDFNTPADTEPDGDVDGADFLAIQRTNPSLIPQWEAGFGASVDTMTSARAVPESATWVMILAAILWASLSQRRVVS